MMRVKHNANIQIKFKSTMLKSLRLKGWVHACEGNYNSCWQEVDTEAVEADRNNKQVIFKTVHHSRNK